MGHLTAPPSVTRSMSLSQGGVCQWIKIGRRLPERENSVESSRFSGESVKEAEIRSPFLQRDLGVEVESPRRSDDG